MTKKESLKEEDKKPTEEDGKLNKAPEEDDKCNKEVEESEEEEDEEEKKKKKAKKGSESPEADANASNTGNNTIDPNAGVPSQAQNVFVPQSSVSGAREQITPMGKSIDFNKSPLFIELSKQLDGMKKALDSKLEGIEKSYNDRLDNMKKELAKTEEGMKKFYGGSFYKAAGENVAPEGVKMQTISNQIEKGNVRFR